jgi:two-component system, OmpR family, response regulator RegX3
MANPTRRILLVEDEKAIRDAVSAYLEREGYWVTPAADGEVALTEFEKHRFDVVVLDLMLPKISGEEVCRSIRDTSDVPIIMLTAKGETEDRIAGLELGADDYLVKPFSPRELVARVRALLRRARADEEPQRDRLDFGNLVIDVAGAPEDECRVVSSNAGIPLSEIRLRLAWGRLTFRIALAFAAVALLTAGPRCDHPVPGLGVAVRCIRA